jgi:hypothetical protein
MFHILNILLDIFRYSMSVNVCYRGLLILSFKSNLCRLSEVRDSMLLNVSNFFGALQQLFVFQFSRCDF